MLCFLVKANAEKINLVKPLICYSSKCIIIDLKMRDIFHYET